MPIRFRYYPGRDLLIHVGEGDITIEDIEQLRRERQAAGVPASVSSTLTDLRRAHLVLDPNALRAHEEETPITEYGGLRQAEIVEDPQDTAILMLWKKWLPAGIVVEIFSTPEAAYQWLSVARYEGDLDF